MTTLRCSVNYRAGGRSTMAWGNDCLNTEFLSCERVIRFRVVSDVGQQCIDLRSPDGCPHTPGG